MGRRPRDGLAGRRIARRACRLAYVFRCIGTGERAVAAPVAEMDAEGRGRGSLAIPGHAQASSPASMWEILQQRSAWGTFIGLFCFNYLWYFLITWLPFYLVKHRNFSLQTMSYTLGTAFFALAVSVLTAGWIADRSITAGESPTRVLKVFVAADWESRDSASSWFFSSPIRPLPC